MNANKQTALAAYFDRTAVIRDKLECLQALADNHFNHNPDSIDWGHVGDLGRVDTALDELLATFAAQTPSADRSAEEEME